MNARPSLITRLLLGSLLAMQVLGMQPAHAQPSTSNSNANGNTNAPATVVAPPPAPVIRPMISGRAEVEVGKRFILDATRSSIPQGLTPAYTWDFGDGKTETGEETVHLYDKPGKYTVKLTVTVDKQAYTATTEIFAYKQIVTFFYNGERTIRENNLPAIEDLAEKYGTYLHVISSSEGNPLITEDSISEELHSNADIIQRSAVIVGGPSGTSFLSALTKLTSSRNGQMADVQLGTKTIIVSTKDSLWLSQRIAQRMLGTLAPKELVIVSKDPFSTLSFLIQSEKPEELLAKLPKDEYVQMTTQTSQEWPVMLLSWLVTVGVTNGIPSQVLVFILFMPFILTIISFIKQCVGIETVGLFQTLVLVLSFYIIGGTFGTLTMVIATLVGLLMRFVLKKANILYLSKMTLLVSVSSLTVLAMLVGGSVFNIYFGIDTSSSQRALLSIFPMLLIAVQADKLSLLVMNREHPKEYLRLVATYGAVIVSYFLIKSDVLELMVLALPEIVLIPLVLQYLIGRYTGLRFVEYVRFRELFRHDIEE